MEVKKIIWAKWRVHQDGRIDVIATYGAGDGYAQWQVSYESLDAAAHVLGPGFRDVVARAIEAKSYAGRWRP